MRCMYIRVTQGADVDPSRRDDVLAVIREVGLPTMRQQPGFQNVYVCRDHVTGRGAIISMWDTQEHASFDNREVAPEFVARIQALNLGNEPPVITVYEVTDQI
jgi:hypothetical protein